jgi:myo-inositol-1(or 4)-monophosphatase
VPPPNVPAEWVDAARRFAEAGAAVALAAFRGPLQVDNKAGGAAYDPVTEADQRAETTMREHIDARFPEHGIVGEEFGVKEGGPWRWVLDPIDGTRGFLCGTPTWTTLVALEFEGEPVVGVICQPVTGETWVGAPDGTWLHRGKTTHRCRVSTVGSLADARLATTDPRPAPHGPMSADEARAFDALALRARVTRFGHDAYAYGLLAIGTLDLVVEAGLQHYDHAALLPVVRGAGGVFEGWSGPLHEGRVIAASQVPVAQQARAVLLA